MTELEAAEEERFHILLDASDRNFGATLESIRLLLTPQGQRETELPVCDGEPCSFPDGARFGSTGSCDNGNGSGNCGNNQDGATEALAPEIPAEPTGAETPKSRRSRSGRSY